MIDKGNEGRDAPGESSGVSEGAACDSDASMSELNDESSDGTEEFEEAGVLVDRPNRRLGGGMETGVSGAEVDSTGVSTGRFACRRRLAGTGVVGGWGCEDDLRVSDVAGAISGGETGAACAPVESFGFLRRGKSSATASA